MRNSSDGQHQKTLQGKANNGFLPSSFRAISSYLKIVSSGASTVARSAASVAQSIVDRDGDANHDMVLWAGFDKLEGHGNVARCVLLLGYRSGFQVWDVEEADNVRILVSRHDGPVSFMQMLPKLIASKRSEDEFVDSRPLLVICADGTHSGDCHPQDRLAVPYNGTSHNYHDVHNSSFVPTVVQFYSMRSHSYVHVLKFRSVVHSVRCSSRIVAISQASQIHCFNATSLEREYTIVTNPVVIGSPGLGGQGYGPLAVGARWLAYSGSPVVVSNSGRANPQHLTPSATFSGFMSNGSFVAHYARESSKQLAAGIVTLGDIGYKKLSRYCSELLPDSHDALQSGIPGWKGNGTTNGHVPDADNVGMVVVRDIVSKLVITQFRAHKSPISALCFDPRGTLLVTASVQGHNINVFKIMPGLLGSSTGGAGVSYAHIYRLQRGFTNAIIQDISFSVDSNWIMISSSRGTSHLFAINPLGESANFQSSDSSYNLKNGQFGVITNPTAGGLTSSGLQLHDQQSLCAPAPPVTLSAVSRIRNGNNGWRGTATGAAVAASGRLTPIPGAIASSFHNCQGNGDSYADTTLLKAKYHLLVFSPSGCMIQYVLRMSAGADLTTIVSGSGAAHESAPEIDGKLVVEAIQKWNIFYKQNRRDQEDNVDIYGENGNLDSSKIHLGGMRKGNTVHPECQGGLAQQKMNSVEKHHLYISEAELQMHQAHVPFWAKPQIYFQSMITERLKLDEEGLHGEIEIERVPTRMIEARSRDLVPVMDYLQKSRFHHSRDPALDCNINWRLQLQRSGISENGRLTRRSSSGSLDSGSSSGSLDSGTNAGGSPAELCNGIAETGWNGQRMPIETRGFVNCNDSPKANARLKIVNNRDILRKEDHINFVNSHNQGPKMENHFEDEGDEFD